MFKAMIIGNLGKDAEEREHNGKKFLSFTVAVSDKDKDNNERTQWISVTTNQLALKDYLKKGKQVCAVVTGNSVIVYCTAVFRRDEGGISLALHGSKSVALRYRIAEEYHHVVCGESVLYYRRALFLACFIARLLAFALNYRLLNVHAHIKFHIAGEKGKGGECAKGKTNQPFHCSFSNNCLI